LRPELKLPPLGLRPASVAAWPHVNRAGACWASAVSSLRAAGWMPLLAAEGESEAPIREGRTGLALGIFGWGSAAISATSTGMRTASAASAAILASRE